MAVNALDRIVTNLLATGAAGRDAVTVGPFRAFLWRHGDDPLMSFATPVGPEPADWGPHIEALGVAFGERTLRLEYFEELHPTLAAALKATGIQQDKSSAVMLLARDAFHPMLKITGGSFTPTDDANLEEFFVAHNDAFGMAVERVAAWLPLMRAGLEAGTMMAAANYIGGKPVAGATLLIGGGTAELAGVWTSRERRGRGLGGDICSRLLNDYFEARHATVWLSSDADQGGLYRRLGFSLVGTQLNFGRIS